MQLFGPRRPHRPPSPGSAKNLYDRLPRGNPNQPSSGPARSPQTALHWPSPHETQSRLFAMPGRGSTPIPKAPVACADSSPHPMLSRVESPRAENVPMSDTLMAARP